MPADRSPAVVLLALLAVLASQVRADDGDGGVPDLEFLEYLGTLVREDDRWLDPSDLRGPAEAERDGDASLEARVDTDEARAGAEGVRQAHEGAHEAHDGGLE